MDKSFEDIFLVIIFNLRFFFPISVQFCSSNLQIKLDINYSNELKHKCSQKVNLMALNETFTIQEINLDKKDLSSDFKQKELEAYWNNECEEHPRTTIANFFMINTMII